MEQFDMKQDNQIVDGLSPSAKHISSQEELLREYRFDELSQVTFYAYGVGHFLNDLTASYWFNFSLYFLVTVSMTEAAAFTFLMGQLVDSICTPLVGYLSDRWSSRYGQRTPWYCIGYFIVIMTFPFIFRVYRSTRSWEMFYYGTFASLFNVGWAFCQISHMSLVPSISCSKSRKERLNNYRNTASFIANFVLLSLVSHYLGLKGSHDSYFFLVSLIIVVLGSMTTLFFLYHVRQNMLVEKCKRYRGYLSQMVSPQEQPMVDHHFKWYFWFKKASFYFVGFAYVTARLSVNVMITILPFYVKKLSHSTQKDITIALLLLYLSSIITSTLTKKITALVGHKWILCIGFVLSILASGILFCAFNTVLERYLIFFATFVIGIGQAIILNSVLNFICQIIGSNGLKGGFVFGSYSFMDKISTGIVVYLISNGAHLSNGLFLKYLILLLPPMLSLFSCLMICLSVPKEARDEEDVAPRSLLEKQLM